MPLFVPPDVQRIFFRRMDAEALIQSDFTNVFSVAEGVQAISAAGGGLTGTSIPFVNGHPGIWNIFTGAASAAGRTFVLSRTNSFMVGVGGVTKFESWVELPVLSTVAQRFTARTGFFSIALPNIILSGIGFEYNDAENGGRWQAITDDGGETSTDTGILVEAFRWYKLSFVVNADGTEVQFFINDILVATNTTNLPTGIGFAHFVNMHVMKLIGLGTRSFLLDAYAVFQETGGRE